MGLKECLGERDLKLTVDFVHNHAAFYQPWVIQHPEFYNRSSAADLELWNPTITKMKTSSASYL